MYSSFQSAFAGTLDRKFTTKWSLKIIPHFKRVKFHIRLLCLAADADR